MIIWKGYGFLVAIIVIAIGATTSWIFSKSGSTEDMGAAVGAIISGAVIWFVGNRLNAPEKSRTLVDKQTGQEVVVKPGHSFFFIPVQYWAFIAGGFGIIMLIDVAMHGKSSF